MSEGANRDTHEAAMKETFGRFASKKCKECKSIHTGDCPVEPIKGK